MGTLREVYRLPLRGAEGLLRSLFTLMEVTLAVPCYSRLWRVAPGSFVDDPPAQASERGVGPDDRQQRLDGVRRRESASTRRF
nr:transposase [Thermoflexales bacterium]